MNGKHNMNVINMVEHGNNIFEMTHSIFSLLFAVFEVLSFCMADLRR